MQPDSNQTLTYLSHMFHLKASYFLAGDCALFSSPLAASMQSAHNHNPAYLPTSQVCFKSGSLGVGVFDLLVA